MLKLRPYTPADAAAVAAWFSDETEFFRWSAGCLGDYPLTAECLNEHFAVTTADGSEFPMTLTDDGIPAGHITLRYPDKSRTHIRFCFIAVDGSKRGKHLGRRMVELATAYAFGTLGAERITLGVFEDNAPAISCYRAAGFVPSSLEAWTRTLGDRTWAVLPYEITREMYEHDTIVTTTESNE